LGPLEETTTRAQKEREERCNIEQSPSTWLGGGFGIETAVLSCCLIFLLRGKRESAVSTSARYISLARYNTVRLQGMAMMFLAGESEGYNRCCPRLATYLIAVSSGIFRFPFSQSGPSDIACVSSRQSSPLVHESPVHASRLPLTHARNMSTGLPFHEPTLRSLPI
jgi:hypothetical protein